MSDRTTGVRYPMLPLVLVAVAVVAALTLAVLVTRDEARDQPTAAEVQLVDPGDAYDPVAAGEPLPEGYRRGLARDAIAPVYQPAFASPEDVDWPSDTLVIGVAEGGEAKAYPVTHLNQHEMVIDSLAGIPILVTW